jgi:PAS domain S-box-containing protein
VEDRVGDDLGLDHKRTEEALRDSEARYRRLFETAQDGILILDGHSGLITDVNPFLVNLLDYPKEEFIGKTLWDIGPFKNIEASKVAFRELQAKQYIRYENLPLEAKSGRRINVEFVSNVYGVDGKSIIQCNIRDITARKHAEEAGERLRQSQKMEALGQLAAGVAHDFNNLLGVILGCCELLELRLAPDDSKRKMVEQIHGAGTRAAALARQLLAFSRRQVLRPVVLDLNELVTGMVTLLRRLIAEDIEVTTSLLPGLGYVKADPTQIEQVLMNLAVNARDAMPGGGKLTIETANVELDDSHACQHAGVKPGSYVMLAMSDAGRGMDTETQDRIFEPFFTTKEPGKGTGLGLSTVYGIVKQSAGFIYAHSEPGKGTTMKVYLPHVAGDSAVLRPDTPPSLRRGSETILLVEDDNPLREMARKMLEDLGYAVVDSASPFEAIRAAERLEGPIALLITDLLMPELNGRVLAQTLTAVRPEMKVLYISGYTANASAEQLELETGFPLLEKPFTRDALAKKVRALLDSDLV